MKTLAIKDGKLTQAPATFKDKDTGKDVDFNEYVLHIEGRAIKVRPSRDGRSKVYLEDIFELIK
jgi:hypothetical protein